MLRRNTTAHGDSIQGISIALSVYFHSVNGSRDETQRTWAAKPISHEMSKLGKSPPPPPRWTPQPYIRSWETKQCFAAERAD